MEPPSVDYLEVSMEKMLSFLRQKRCVCVFMCVFITAGPGTKLFAWGGGGYGRTCATRDDEPRPVWTRLPITH